MFHLKNELKVVSMFGFRAVELLPGDGRICCVVRDMHYFFQFHPRDDFLNILFVWPRAPVYTYVMLVSDSSGNGRM